jgi:hypothetical protein
VREPIVARQQFKGLGDTEMTSHGVIVVHTEKFQTEIIVIWDVDEIIVEQETVIP